MKIKNYYIFIIFLTLLTDITIILDIPIIRQVFSFLFYTIIPGLIILHILKLDKIEKLKVFIFAIGLSISFLIFVGLVINQLYLNLGFLEPISMPSLVITFGVIIIILCISASGFNKNSSLTINFKFHLKEGQLISPLLFSIIFPFMAILGTQFMNTKENNIIILSTLFLIPTYIIVLVYLKDSVPKITFPVAILMLSMAFVIMRGLTSNYIIGRDVHEEYYAFRVVADYQYWSMDNHNSVLTAVLGTSLLPAIYTSLLGINKIYVFKLVLQLVFSITPLVCYLLYNKYLEDIWAFLASLFLMIQVEFLFELQSAVRQEVALLFFALTMIVLFDDKLDKLDKKILLLIFMISMIFSHYTTAYIFLFIMLSTWLIIMRTKNIFRESRYIIAGIVALCSIIIFFWYSQITTESFNGGVHFIKGTIDSLKDIFIAEARGSSPLRVFGIGSITMADKISTMVHDIGFIFISIGVVCSIIKYKRSMFDKEYILITLLCMILLICLIIIPFLSKGYGAGRLYQQLLILLAPMFIIGGKFALKYFQQKICYIVILTVLILQFFSATYIIHQITGVPISIILNKKGYMHAEAYIYDQEVIGAEWLNRHKTENFEIYSDFGGSSRLLMGSDARKRPESKNNFFVDNVTADKYYLYLRYLNVIKHKVQKTGFSGSIDDISKYFYLFAKKGNIYSNGYTEIYT